MSYIDSAEVERNEREKKAVVYCRGGYSHSVRGYCSLGGQPHQAAGQRRGNPARRPPQIINGRTMVPVRWVAEALGFDVTWNPGKKQVEVIHV